MLLWFHLVIPSFPTRIDDMRIRFSALSVTVVFWLISLVDPMLIGSVFCMLSFVVSGPDKKPKGVGGGGELLPYVGYKDMHGPRGSGFQPVRLLIAYTF